MTELALITPADRDEVTRTASEVVVAAREITVTSQATYTSAATFLKRVKDAQIKLKGKKDGMVRPINQGLKAIRDLFRQPEDELAEAESLVKRQLLGYEAEQEELRREEQRKLDLIAAREREDKERRAREAEEKARAEREAGNARKADQLQAKADLLAEASAAVVAPIVQREPPRIAGIASRETWSAVVLDLKALVKAIAAGEVPTLAVLPNQPFLNTQARALKRELAYPGVRAVVEKGIAAGSK
jgi:hypothetical protein